MRFKKYCSLKYLVLFSLLSCQQLGTQSLFMQQASHGNYTYTTTEVVHTLHSAAYQNESGELSFLLRQGKNPNSIDPKTGYTPIHFAVQQGHYSPTILLKDAGANLNARSKKGWTPLQMAAYWHHIGIARYLIDHGAYQDAKTTDKAFTPLHLATQENQYRIAELLCINKADVDAKTSDHFTPLHIAAQYKNHGQLIRLLLRYGADAQKVNKEGFMPLHTASYWGHDGIIRALLPEYDSLNIYTHAGFVPLHLAAMQGHYYAVKALLEEGKADPLALTCAKNAAKEALPGTTARYLAIAQKHEKVAQLLLAHEKMWQPKLEAQAAKRAKDKAALQQAEAAKKACKSRYRGAWKEFSDSFEFNLVTDPALIQWQKQKLQGRAYLKKQLIKSRSKRDQLVQVVQPTRQERIALGLDPDGVSSDEEAEYSRAEIAQTKERIFTGSQFVLKEAIWLCIPYGKLFNLGVALGKGVRYNKHVLATGEVVIEVLKSSKAGRELERIAAKLGGKVLSAESKLVKGARASKTVGRADKGISRVVENAESFIKDAVKPDRNGLSKVGRGLQKHSSRKKSSFSNINFSHKDADKVGGKVLKDILNSKNQKIVLEKNSTKTIYDLTTGRGINISREGLFNGFREYPK